MTFEFYCMTCAVLYILCDYQVEYCVEMTESVIMQPMLDDGLWCLVSHVTGLDNTIQRVCVYECMHMCTLHSPIMPFPMTFQLISPFAIVLSCSFKQCGWQTGMLLSVVNTLCLKKHPDISRCNSSRRCWILIIFGRLIW